MVYDAAGSPSAPQSLSVSCCREKSERTTDLDPWSLGKPVFLQNQLLTPGARGLMGCQLRQRLTEFTI